MEGVSRFSEADKPSRRYTLLGSLAAAICIVAGFYLLTSGSASSEATVFDALFHGIGGYMIARGVWMIAEINA